MNDSLLDSLNRHWLCSYHSNLWVLMVVLSTFVHFATPIPLGFISPLSWLIQVISWKGVAILYHLKNEKFVLYYIPSLIYYLRALLHHILVSREFSDSWGDICTLRLFSLNIRNIIIYSDKIFLVESKVCHDFITKFSQLLSCYSKIALYQYQEHSASLVFVDLKVHFTQGLSTATAIVVHFKTWKKITFHIPQRALDRSFSSIYLLQLPLPSLVASCCTIDLRLHLASALLMEYFGFKGTTAIHDILLGSFRGPLRNASF